MLYINSNGEIRLTRGDTAYIQVGIKLVNPDGTSEDYEMADGDKLYLSAKESINDTAYSFQKVITGTNIFHILPQDTEGLDFGAYVYDVQIITENGDVYTIIEPTVFELLSEVTIDEQ